MDLDHLTERLSHGVEGLRDRTAEAVSSDGHSVFRELRSLGKQLSHVEDQLEALPRLEERLELLAGALLGDREEDGKRTTWPRRLFWLALGAGVGVAAAYLGDPDRGRTRRDLLTDQLAASARDVGDEAAGRAQVAVDRAKGAAIETVKRTTPDRPETDPTLLEHRVKSHALGGRDDVRDVVLRIDGPGVVALKGTVPSPDSERDLVDAVAEVDGVIDVRSELTVRSG